MVNPTHAWGGDDDDDDDKMEDDEWERFLTKVGEYSKARVWTWNEIVDHPMFMTDMPADISHNKHLLALQALMYEDETAESMALHFKKMGNDFMAINPPTAISRQNSLAAYSKALEMESEDKFINSQLHSNRAQVALYLGEYSKAVDDCRAAIVNDKTNKKAYYRGAQASLKLGLARQAVKFLEKLMEMDPDSTEVKALYKKALDALSSITAAKERENEKRSKELSQKDVERKALNDYLEARECSLYPCLYEISMYQRHGEPEIYPYLAGDEHGSVSVQWPALFLIPEYNQSDFVLDLDEDIPLMEQFKHMFPKERHPEWDEGEKYIWPDICAFLEYYPERTKDKEQMHKELKTDQPLKDQLDMLKLPYCLPIHLTVRDSPMDKLFRESERFK